MHPIAVRRILYVLLATSLTNASGWTFKREAVADVFFAGWETACSMKAAEYRVLFAVTFTHQVFND